MVTAPLHGTVVANYVATDTTDIMQPTGLYYTAAPGYTGNDSFKIQVTDCVGMADTTTIHVLQSSLPPVLGILSVCSGATTRLSDATTGGTWSSANPGIATIDAAIGEVRGVTAGTTTISYSAITTCGTLYSTAVVTINPLPVVTGPAAVCPDATINLGVLPATGGTWSSSNTASAIVSGTGVVTGVAPGTATINFTNTAGCAIGRAVSILPVSPILGVTNMCAFGATLPLYDSAGGGIWTSSLVSVSPAGIVTPYSSGLATVTYSPPAGCRAIVTLTVNPLPGPILCVDHLCVGSTAAVADTTAGGAWSTSNTLVAIATAAVISALHVGVDTIIYTAVTGCSATRPITVDIFPAVDTIHGPSAVCAGATIVLSDSTSGGAWTSSNTAATVLAGTVAGIAAGSTVISYSLSNSCGTVVALRPVTINPLPFAGAISGPRALCTGDSILLTDGITGGVWSSSGADATVTNGTVAGISPGTDTIRYTITNSCGTDFTVVPITINPLPDAGVIAGPDSICAGSSATLSETVTGGLWGVSNSHISITVAGVITAISAGVDTVTYTLTNTCGTAFTVHSIDVNTIPLPGTISGDTSVCIGIFDTLRGTPSGGVWSVSNANVAVVPIPLGIIVTGLLPGADTIIYTMINECGHTDAAFPLRVPDGSECDTTTQVPGSASEMGRLQVWPNPNDGAFTILVSSNVNEEIRLTITNMIGQTIKEISAATNQGVEVILNTASGIYFVTAATATGKYVTRVSLH